MTSLDSHLIQLIEYAFVQASLKSRLDWLLKALKCSKSPAFLEALFKHTSQFKYFVQWLIVGPLSDDPQAQEIRISVRKLHGTNISQKDTDYDSQIARMNFQARLKPEKIESHLIE